MAPKNYGYQQFFASSAHENEKSCNETAKFGFQHRTFNEQHPWYLKLYFLGCPLPTRLRLSQDLRTRPSAWDLESRITQQTAHVQLALFW